VARRRFLRHFKYTGWDGINFSSVSAFQAAGKETKAYVLLAQSCEGV
jgi:hypothetical protein